MWVQLRYYKYLGTASSYLFKQLGAYIRVPICIYLVINVYVLGPKSGKSKKNHCIVVYVKHSAYSIENY